MYYVEPSIAMKMSTFNGIGSSSQHNSSSNSATSNLSSSSTAVNKIRTQEIALTTNSVENNNSKLYINGNVNSHDKAIKPALSIDPFEPAQSSFANFDNAPIFNATSTVPGTGSLMIAPVSNSPAVPTEDRYAALKDLDCLMKSQIAASTVPNTPAQEMLHPPPVNNPDPWGNSIATPTPNGMWNSTPAVRPKEASHPINGFSSNPFANDNNWISENGINNGELNKNPFKSSKLFSDWPGTNGSNDLTSSQSFSTFQWLSSNNHPNPFAVNGFAGSPPTNSAYHSSNPFL